MTQNIGSVVLFLYVIDPINFQCTDKSFISAQPHYIENTPITEFNLPAFSQTVITADLRHLKSIPNREQQQFPNFYLQLSINDEIKTLDVNLSINSYKLFATKDLKVCLYFQLSHKLLNYHYLLINSTSFEININNRRIPTNKNSFLFIFKSSNHVALPYNKPTLNSSDFFLQKYQGGLSQSRLTTIQHGTNYWNSNGIFAVPYIPFLSNCNGSGNYLYLSQLMQSRQCDLVSINDTIPINEFLFGSQPKADKCIIKKECIYDEINSIKNDFPSWQTLTSGSKLFQMTMNQISSEQFKVDSKFLNTELISCKIKLSKGMNNSNLFPLKVKLTIGYYQLSKVQKRMINCSLEYSLYVQSTKNFHYQLEIETIPLNHTYIMLSFGFDWYIYMIVFVLIGTISNLQNFILYIYHNCASAYEKKPFRVKVYLRVLKQILQGTLIALLMFCFLVFIVSILMNGKVFDNKLHLTYEANQPRVIWDYLDYSYIKDYDSAEMITKRVGRMGFSFFIIGSYIILSTSHLFMSCQKNKAFYEQYSIMGRKLRPRKWNRGKFLFGTFFYIGLQFIFIYFAYSKLYSQNIWAFILMMKVIQIILQEITKSIYQDILVCLPMKVITDIIAYMNTLSANNFYDFLFSFLIDVAITMIEKSYVSQLQNIVVAKIQTNFQQMNKLYTNLINDTQDEIQIIKQISESNEQDNLSIMMFQQVQQVIFFEDDIKQQYQNLENEQEFISQQCQSTVQQQQYKKKLMWQILYSNNNHKNKLQVDQNSQYSLHRNNQEYQIEQSSIMFEMLIDNIIMLFTFFIQPFVVLLFWLTYEESSILNKYGISLNTVILYLLSSVVIAIFSIVNVILIFHVLQSYLNINFQEYIDSLLIRFHHRNTFWKADDEDINCKIDVTLRGAQHYCLSSQFFFIMSIYIGSMVMVLIGVAIMMNNNFNMFQDIIVSVIAIFWCVFLALISYLIRLLANMLNFWGYKDFQQVSNNQSLPMQNSTFTQNALITHEMTKSNLITPLMIKSENLSMQQLIQQSEQNQKNHIKLKVICKRLQPQFSNQQFRKNFCSENKQYIRENIHHILPLVQSLPEIQYYKNSKNQSQVIKLKKQTKIFDPIITQILLKWLNSAKNSRQRRIKNGLEYQKKVKKCNYCFQTWGLYYGYDGICLNCSKQLIQSKKNQ